MPISCCVPRCKGNYVNGPKVSIYRFPREESLKLAWLAAIKRKDFTPNQNSRVCELHFEEGNFIKEARGFDEKTGKILSAPLKVKRLKNSAVPSKFPLYPDYYVEPKVSRECPELKREAREEAALSKAMEESILQNEVYEASITFRSLQQLDLKDIGDGSFQI